MGELTSLVDTCGKVWIRPEGDSENPISSGSSFCELTNRLHFTRRRPSGVAIGNVIIDYGVGATNVIMASSVISDINRYPEVEEQLEPWKHRWPHFVEGMNLTPYYSASWWKHDLTLKTLREDFLAIHPSTLVTLHSQSLGSLQYGSDHVQLSTEFSRFVLERLENANAK